MDRANTAMRKGVINDHWNKLRELCVSITIPIFFGSLALKSMVPVGLFHMKRVHLLNDNNNHKHEPLGYSMYERYIHT